MKRKSQLVLVGLLLASLLLSSCGGGETPVPTAAPTSVPEPTTAPEPTAVPEPTEVPAPEVSADTTAILDPAGAYFGEGYNLITAEALYENLNDGDESNDPYIIDIRKAEDYDVGHISGAVNIGGKVFFGEETLATLPTDGQIVVTCYTGQTAGQVVGALNTLGYDAYSLKFGMISWAIAEDAPRWNDGMSMAYPADTEAAETEGANDLPAPIGAEAYFGEGFQLITAEALYENLNDGDDSNDPAILDIRSGDDYAIGHVPGAVSIGGGALFNADTLNDLPTDGQVVVYCYSGQTAGQVVGVLNMLGYDAYSLKFGYPSWTTEGVTKGLWNDDMSMSYPTEGAAVSFLESAAAYFGEGYQLITAEALYENLNDGDDANDPFIIDIRKAEDYAVGHIPGAVNIGGKVLFGEETLATLPTGGQIVVTCYTGQTAGQVVGALNTLGYDAYSLKFGMISWAIAEGAPRWNDGLSMAYPADTEAVEMAGSNDLPTPLESAHAYFAEGFQLITAEALYENLNDGDDSNDPYILDIRSGDDYAVGHVPGAVNVGGGALFNADTLAALPTDGQVVVACYSGQTAGQVVGVLNMLGYDAYSLKFGMASWAIVVDKGLWRDDMSADYPVESGAAGGDVLDAAGAYFGEGYQLITAEALYENLNDGDDANDPVILDIRKAEDYGVGHVPGAVNMGGGAVFSAETLAALPADGQVVVYCYTGQTAGQVVGALNVLGYDAYSMKFGMPSWAIAEDAPRWNSDMSMSYPMDTEAAEMAGENAMPAPVDAAAYFGEGYQLITAEALYENLNDGDDSNDPAILDIRSGDDYALGHIPGSVSVGGGALFNADTLNDLPTDGQVVVYCYSGQTAGQVVGALNLLGYDAYSLKFGYPSWTTENVSKGLWNDDISMGYPIDTEVHELP